VSALCSDNEVELAGVMAQELATGIARRQIEKQTKATLLQYGALG
jgi:predicted Zn-dependent protease